MLDMLCIREVVFRLRRENISFTQNKFTQGRRGLESKEFYCEADKILPSFLELSRQRFFAADKKGINKHKMNECCAIVNVQE